jgi:hypothetical protein
MMHADMPSPLANILNDVTRAIDVKLYYPALTVALTIPEICVTLCWDREMMVKQRHYAEFVDKYTTPKELGLGGIDCYRLRGGVIHRGNAAGHNRFNSSHVIFTVPETSIHFHAMSITSGGKSAAMFDIRLFCNAMLAAADQWYLESVQNH